MRARLKDMSIDFASRKQIVSFIIDKDFAEEFDRLKDKPLTVEVKQYRERRSNNANAYMWVLCEKIAQTQGIGAEEVYRHAIREVGVHVPLPIKAEAVERFQTEWGKRGIGWFAEIVDDSKLEGYKLVFVYYGSSTYTSSEMARLIDNIVQDAQALGIQTDPREELDRLIREWDK